MTLHLRPVQFVDTPVTQADGTVARLASERGVTALVQISAIGADPASPPAYARGKALSTATYFEVDEETLASSWRGTVATLKALIDAGANLQLEDRSGQTPLALAKSRGYSAMVSMLEKAGAR